MYFMEKYLLGMDIGTTATKGILLDPLRGIAAEAEAPAQLISPKAGWAEENPEEWWQNVGDSHPGMPSIRAGSQEKKSPG